MNDDVNDLRSAGRYIAATKLNATFGITPVEVLDLSEHGAQVTHGARIRLGTSAAFRLRHRGVSFTVRAVVVWSRFGNVDVSSTTAYRSGLRLEGDAGDYAAAVRELADLDVLRPDVESLDRKRRQRALRKERPPVQGRVEPAMEITEELVKVIRYAKKRLDANPEELHRCLSRANAALREKNGAAPEARNYPSHVLAIWEFIQRSVPLATVNQVLADRSR